MRLLYEDNKDRYWRNEIVSSEGNMQRLWKTLHSALGETSGGETGDHTADEFATFLLIRLYQCEHPPLRRRCMMSHTRQRHSSQNGPR